MLGGLRGRFLLSDISDFEAAPPLATASLSSKPSPKMLLSSTGHGRPAARSTETFVALTVAIPVARRIRRAAVHDLEMFEINGDPIARDQHRILDRSRGCNQTGARSDDSGDRGPTVV
jgi:hypothetical protein